MTAVEPEDELEIAAHTTDADAVRNVFDANNVVWTAVQSSIFTLADILMVIYSFVSPDAPRFSWLVSIVMMIASGLIAQRMSVERRAPSRGVAVRNLSDWIVGYFLAQMIVLVYVGGKQGPSTWGVIFPFILIGLRFTFVRRVAFNASMFAITVTFMYLRDPRFRAGLVVGYAIAYAIAIAIGSLASRRVRRKTIEQWTQRRTSAREQLRMRDELRYARELQLSMLPEGAPVLDWADIAGVSIPATEVGGDYFDYIDVDGALAVICGDVAGHGMASGITLSALRGGITLLRREFLHPAAVLERLQEVVTESSRKRTLVTLAAVLFDPLRRVATVANAGHPPILVRRASGRVDSIELFGPPLGVRRNVAIPEVEVAFGPGDIFLLHSDGVYEATNANGDQYGLDRLASLLATLDGSAAEVRDGVLRSVAEYRGTAPQQDDVTVVVVKIK